MRRIIPTFAGVVIPSRSSTRRRVDVVERVDERTHPRRHDVGEHPLVLAAVAGQLLDAVGRRPLQRNASVAGQPDDLADPVTLDALGQHDLVDDQARVVEHLDDRVPAVDRDEPLFRRNH